MKTTRLSGGSFCKRTYTMFEPKYNNHSIVGAEEAGVVKRPVKNKNTGFKYQTKLTLFLNEYQYEFNEGRSLPEVPSELKPLINQLRFLFRLERDNIANIIKTACRLKLPRKSGEQNRNTKKSRNHHNRRKG